MIFQNHNQKVIRDFTGRGNNPKDNVSLQEKQLQHELDLARKIQAQLLNGKKPNLIGSELTGVSIPARLVGGDYYDFYLLKSGSVRIIIGDVMGKGIPAAMLMILTRGAFRSAAQAQATPGKTLTAMNNALFEDLRKLRAFVTVLCADYDPKHRTLTYATAGHHMPIHVQAKEKNVCELPKVRGVMLGGLQNQKYVEETIPIHKGDVIFLYTDGIIEAEKTDGEQFKMERLKDALAESTSKDVVQLQDDVVQSVHTFTKEAPQKDDITMVILKV